MGTTQDFHALRVALSEAHRTLQQAQQLAVRCGLSPATLRRINTLLEDARDNVTGAGTTLRADALWNTAAPAPIRDVLEAAIADFGSRARRLAHFAEAVNVTHDAGGSYCGCGTKPNPAECAGCAELVRVRAERRASVCTCKAGMLSSAQHADTCPAAALDPAGDSEPARSATG
jgi:hypothetical protein